MIFIVCIIRVKSHRGAVNDITLHQLDGFSGFEPLSILFGAIYSCSLTLNLVFGNGSPSNPESRLSASLLFQSWTSTRQSRPITLNCKSLSWVIVMLIDEN